MQLLLRSKRCMKKILSFIFISCFLAACNNSDSPSNPSSSERLSAASFDCEKSFEERWCSQNLSPSSNVTSVCSGNISAGDIIYSALYLKSSKGNSCLIDLGPGIQATNISGCANSYQTQYSSALGDVAVRSCSDASGKQVYIDGATLSGQAFQALHLF